MHLSAQIHQIAQDARLASRILSRLSPERLDLALECIARELESQASAILEANARDLLRATTAGLSGAMLERLRLTPQSLQEIANSVRQVRSLPNPLNATLRSWEQPNGLQLQKVRVPIGVIGIIYESRPNVTVDAAVLCLKTGNAVILRGGSEAFESNQALAQALRSGLKSAGLPESAAQALATIDREAIIELCKQDQYIDVMIPRGGHGLIETVVEHARMPVIKHFHGVCHVYVHSEADFEMAQHIVINAKCQRPSVCNALETLLIDEAIAPSFVPQIVRALLKQGVEIRGDELTQQLGKGEGTILPATQADWTTEYLELILSIRVVKGFEEAIDHLDRYGSKHSDAIITRNAEVAQRFFREVDSATVYWNASTRFTDGGQFGFGAEIGISTDKLHARGPMGLEELTSYKYLISGEGQIRT